MESAQCSTNLQDSLKDYELDICENTFEQLLECYEEERR